MRYCDHEEREVIGTMKSMKRMKSMRNIGAGDKEEEHGVQGIHEAQLLTYMKLARIRQGFLINFNVRRLKDGLRSFLLQSFVCFMVVFREAVFMPFMFFMVTF